MNLVWKQLLLQITFMVSEQALTLTTQTARVYPRTPPSRTTCFRTAYYYSYCLILGVSGLRHSFKTFSEGGEDGKMKEWRKSETQRFYIIYMINIVVYLCVSAHVGAGVIRGQKTASVLLMLKLQVVITDTGA